MLTLKSKIIIAAIGFALAPISLHLGVVPISMQTLVLFTVAALLTPKEALIFGLLYLVLGAIGVPIFGGFTAGFEKLYGPTSGFLWGFPVLCAFISWDVKQNPPAFIHLAISFFKAHVLLLIPGFLVLYFLLPGVKIWDTFVQLLPGLFIKTTLGALLVLGLKKGLHTA